MGWVTLDIDDQFNVLPALKFYDMFKEYGPEVRESSDGGYHLRAFVDKPIKADTIFYIREYCGDCPGRLWMDLNRKYAGLPFGMLFDIKKGKHAQKWRTLDKELPFMISKIPYKKRVRE